MPERKARLRATLAQLRAQLEDGEPVDEALREELHATMREIEETLEAGASGGEDEPGLGDRLSDLALRFEGSHPRLAEAVGRLIRGLSELGI